MFKLFVWLLSDEEDGEEKLFCILDAPDMPGTLEMGCLFIFGFTDCEFKLPNKNFDNLYYLN